MTSPFRPFQPDFDKNLCKLDYMSIFQSLYAFNLAPDLAIVGHEQPYRDGNLRLEFKFAKSLPNTINVVLMAMFDGRIELTKSRDVLLDYKS